MDRGLIVAAQLSSIFPSTQAASFTVLTSRHTSALPPVPDASGPPVEHASYSAVLHTPDTGTILLRVLHGGVMLEIISLSTTIQPVRLVFPVTVLPSPAVFLWGTQLHVMAVTSIGSLHRIVIPTNGGVDLWQGQTNGITSHEYQISNFPTAGPVLVHVQGTHCVVIGQPGGAILRLESEGLETQDGEEEWAETLFQHGSFLTSWTSLLPLSSTPSSGSEIVSIATHQWPTDVGHVWTLSRDRTLRFWKAKVGCVSSKVLTLVSGRETSPVPSRAGTPLILLDSERQTLLRVFSSESSDDHIYVLAFVPGPHSPLSGGTFHLLGTVSDQFHEIGTIECSKNSAHCHLQDFMVISDVLYTLWERQGQSLVERMHLRTDLLADGELFQAQPWHSSSYATEPELTPGYLEELLVTPGSMTDKFFEAIMRPGMFSALTLQTAVDQYSDACASLPGPTPPQLSASYSTIGETIAAVVGCTVTLNRDPHTGALQHSQYWNALKRDWEGFIARCRELERSARWPLVLGAKGEGDIIVVERERVGSLVTEDLPIRLRRNLGEDKLMDPAHALLGVLWGLQAQLGAEFMLSLESRLADILSQEIAFSFTDIIQDQVARVKFEEALENGARSWMDGRLQTIPDIDAATRSALDVIGGFDSDVKREEDEVEMLLPVAQSDWSRALTAAYVNTTVNARYDLCLSLATLMFFFAADLADWDPALLAEVFAVFRGIAILRFLTRQSTMDERATEAESDDVIARLQNMNVSRAQRQISIRHSLIHRLLVQSSDTLNLLGSAHRFLDSTGLLQSVTPASATKYEVIFCERLRALGHHESTREILSWLPRTAGVIYVQARLWLSIGRAEDAAHLLEKLAGAFGPENALSQEDHEALSFVLPATDPFDSTFFFYLHAAKLFKAAALVQYEVQFTALALSTAPPEGDLTSLWSTVIKGFTDLGLYDDAYSALLATPSEKLIRECIAYLVYRMCEDNAVEQLVGLSFPGFAEEVEEALSFKARNVDPRILPSYSRILYSWYTSRADHRNAALVMYQRARKIQDLIGLDGSLAASLATQQLDAYLTAINSLSLVDEKGSWFLLPLLHSEQPRKRRRVTRHIPDSHFTPGTHDRELVSLSDIQSDYALAAAQAELVKRGLWTEPLFDLPPDSIVLRLAQANRFTLAIATATSLQVDMSDLFTHLTMQCLRLTRRSSAVLQEDTSDWLLTDKTSSWPGTPAERGWRFLRQSLERTEGPSTDYKYSKISLETVLGQSKASPPPWLVNTLELHHPEYLIRIHLKYDKLDESIAHTIALIKKADAQVSQDPGKQTAVTWLPYTLVDQVLLAASETAPGAPPPSGLVQLRSLLDSRLKRMQKLSIKLMP